jgi:hypothetical protein
MARSEGPKKVEIYDALSFLSGQARIISLLVAPRQHNSPSRKFSAEALKVPEEFQSLLPLC